MEVAKILKVKTIKTNYLLSEWLKAQFFESNPLQGLILHSEGVVDEEVAICDDETHLAFVSTQFPECRQDSYNRLKMYH